MIPSLFIGPRTLLNDCNHSATANIWRSAIRCLYASSQTVPDTRLLIIPLLYRGMVSNHVLHFLCMIVIRTIPWTTCEFITGAMSEDIHTAVPPLARRTIC
mgnify:CR=1 FL=1